MWKIVHQAPKGTRILNSRFLGVCHYGDNDLWWGNDQKKWMPTVRIGYDEIASSHAPCRSFKAFKRHLRKHPELNGVKEVVLTSRYQGYNITAYWIGK